MAKRFRIRPNGFVTVDGRRSYLRWELLVRRYLFWTVLDRIDLDPRAMIDGAYVDASDDDAAIGELRRRAAAFVENDRALSEHLSKPTVEVGI